MKEVHVSLVFFISISLISTFYSFFLVASFHTVSIESGKRISKVTLNYPYTIIPISTASLGWLATGYELFSIGRKNIINAIKNELSEKEGGLAIYNIFKGRGGIRRLSIMESLKIPRMKSEIAKITTTDWKEVDRNIRILSSVDLVKTEFIHGSFSVYELTER